MCIKCDLCLKEEASAQDHYMSQVLKRAKHDEIQHTTASKQRRWTQQ